MAILCVGVCRKHRSIAESSWKRVTLLLPSRIATMRFVTIIFLGSALPPELMRSTWYIANTLWFALACAISPDSFNVGNVSPSRTAKSISSVITPFQPTQLKQKMQRSQLDVYMGGRCTVSLLRVGGWRGKREGVEVKEKRSM